MGNITGYIPLDLRHTTEHHHSVRNVAQRESPHSVAQDGICNFPRLQNKVFLLRTDPRVIC